jgi:hypothetical protein
LSKKQTGAISQIIHPIAIFDKQGAIKLYQYKHKLHNCHKGLEECNMIAEKSESSIPGYFLLAFSLFLWGWGWWGLTCKQMSFEMWQSTRCTCSVYSHPHFLGYFAVQKCQAASKKYFLESRLPVSKGIQKDT